MKISKSFLGKICIAAGFILISQLGFATNPVPIPPDGSPNDPPTTGNKAMQKVSAISAVSASAEISDSELAVYFDWMVGNATITVYDVSNQIVYRETVDTNLSTEVYIPVDDLDSGTYKLTVTYGKTTQRGYFQLY